jgi:peptidoglycan/xylan/chitin deacetylase (PgdA/CDA1 family)
MKKLQLYLMRKLLVSPLKKLLSDSRRGLVLAVHGVTIEPIQSPIEQVHINIKNFINIMELLIELEFDFISMNDLVSISDNEYKHRRHWVHLTFDDGYQNIYSGALQWLIEREIPFSIFVSTHHIETGFLFPTFYARFAHSSNKNLTEIYGVPKINNIQEAEEILKYSDCLTHEELLNKIYASFSENDFRTIEKYKNEVPLDLPTLKRLAELPGVHIGSHMHHHWLFHDKQNIELMAADLEVSLIKLKKEWSLTKSPAFCYPNGIYDVNAVSVLHNYGIDVAFTSQSGFVDSTTNRLLIPRFTMSNRLRALGICILCALGNKSLIFFRRYPPSLG